MLPQVAETELGASSAEVLAELRYDLPATYAFHKCVVPPPFIFDV